MPDQCPFTNILLVGIAEQVAPRDSATKQLDKSTTEDTDIGMSHVIALSVRHSRRTKIHYYDNKYMPNMQQDDQ